MQFPVVVQIAVATTPNEPEIHGHLKFSNVVDQVLSGSTETILKGQVGATAKLP